MPPYRMFYLRSKKCYSVRKTKRKKDAKTNTKKVFSKCTTKEKATRQIRLLRALLYNPSFRRTLKTPSYYSLEN